MTTYKITYFKNWYFFISKIIFALNRKLFYNTQKHNDINKNHINKWQKILGTVCTLFFHFLFF